MKKRKINDTIISEIISICVVIILTTVALLIDFNKIVIPSFLSSKISDGEALCFTLFTVQASVATVSIAIVSIITGLRNESVLGVSVTNFITNLKPCLFKHNILIISNIIIILFNYISLYFSCFALCVVLFIISIGITCLLTKATYFVFLGKNKTYKEIETYILNNYKNQRILDDISIELLSAIETGDTIKINNDFNIIKEIFQKELIESNYCNSETISKLSLIICDSFNKIVLKHDAQKSNAALLFICDIYKLANQQKTNPLQLDIWQNIDTSVFRAIKDLSFEQLIDDGAYIILHKELYNNLASATPKQIENSYLQHYSSRLYNSLIDNKKQLDECQKERIKAAIYLPFSYLDGEQNEALFKMRIYEACNLHKAMITCGDIKGIKKLFFEHVKYRWEREGIKLIYIITLIYLYYLAAREDIVKGKELQSLACEILKENRSKIKYFYFRIDINKFLIENLTFIRKVMNDFEHYELDKAKWLIMDRVIDDFCVFVSLGKFWDKEGVSGTVSILSQKMFPLYDRYFAHDNEEKLEKTYAEFESLINGKEDINIIKEKISILHDVFNDQYKKEVLVEKEHEGITKEKQEKVAKKIIDNINEINSEHLVPFFKKENGFDQKEIEKKGQAVIFEITADKIFFNDITNVDHFNEYFHSRMIEFFIRTISNNVDFQAVDYEDKNKQEILINMVKKLPISPDVVVGNREEFRGEENPERLKSYTSLMNKISYPEGYNKYYILDSSLINFSIENIDVEFIDLSWEEIEDKCIKDDAGRLKYNITNDIYIPFEKEELEDYVSKTTKKIIIKADVSMELKNDKVGAGIKISFN